MAPHMVSRWAPASEPPTMARGSCQVSAPAGPSPLRTRRSGGRSPVRRRSATTTSSRASNGSTPRPGPPRRPSGPRSAGVLRARTSPRRSVAPTPPGGAGCRPRRTARPASSRRRVSGSDNAAMRSSIGRANTSRQPGSPSRMAPCSKLRRICMVWGSVRATTVAPRCGRRRPRGQLAPGAVGVHGRDAEHVPVDRPVRQQRHRGRGSRSPPR